MTGELTTGELTTGEATAGCVRAGASTVGTSSSSLAATTVISLFESTICDPACAISESGTPHLVQNFASLINSAPQTLQTISITSLKPFQTKLEIAVHKRA